MICRYLILGFYNPRKPCLKNLNVKKSILNKLKLEFDLATYLEKIKNSNSYFQTFINKPSLAAGVLVLNPEEEDTQEPHDSDEVYYVISGDGFLKIKDKDYKVSKDKVFFIAKDVEHYFHGNKKELKVLYFFGGPDT